MSTRFDLGVVTAYAYAVEGGYTGTEAEFTALLGNIALDLEQIENLSVTVETLPAGSSATASYADGVLSLGIPKGDKGDKGNTGATGPTGATPDISIGTVTTGAVGSDAAATMTGTPEHPVLNLTLPRGATGDVTNLADTFSSSKAYTAGEYVIYNDLLYVFTANHAAGAWNASHVSQVKVGGELTALKEDFNLETGRTFITMETDKGLNLNVNSIDFTDIPYAAKSGYACAVVSCNRGDIFTVTATGYGNYRAWGFFNSDGSKNTIAANGVSVTNEVLTAPADGYLCINDTTGRVESFYGKFLWKDVSALKTKALDIEMLKATKISTHPGKNLFNPNATVITKNKAINDKGNEIVNSTSFISDYIPIEAGESYAITGCVSSVSTACAAFYDSELIVRGVVSATDGVRTPPAHAKYLRVSIANAYIDTAQVEKSSSATSYERYHDTIMAEVALIVKPFSASTSYNKDDLTNYDGLIYKANDDIVAGDFDPTEWTLLNDFYSGIKSFATSSDPKAIHLSKNGLKTKGTALSANTEIDIGKANIAKNVIYELCSKFDSFDSIKIGHGEDSTKYASWVVITPTQITVYEEVGDGNPRTSTYTHGLTISDFLNVQIVTTDNYKCNVKIQTKKAENETGHYETDTEAKFYGNCDGHYYFKPSMTLTEYSFGVIFIDATKPIYLIGDSYMSFDYSTTPSSLRDRWVEYLKDVDQFNNVLINACGGLNTTRALNALENLKGEPKYALWAIGMNDTQDSGTTPNSAWLAGVETFIAWCEERNCTPVLATIPTVPSKNNAGKSAYVRSSGYRYIDMAAAVSASDNGTWYPDMLGTDNVHPTEEGARAMYHRAIAEFPEIMARL